MDTDETLALATEFAREAGALALSMRAGVEQLSTKSTPTDVVTAADKAVEARLLSSIASARPSDGVLGEEGAARTGASGIRWVVDPIDGTVNYLYGIPQWAVSIGVEDAEGAFVGVVYDPSKDELWQAVRGGGSVLNSVSLRCSTVTDLSQALVGTGFGYDSRRRSAQAQLMPTLLPAVRDIRRLGAGSLDLCGVAAGRLDAYYEQSLSPWDLSAGALIASEAGAVVGGLRGKPASADLVLASAPGVFEQLHALLVAHDADRDPLA